jgi:hypothetical protein
MKSEKPDVRPDWPYCTPYQQAEKLTRLAVKSIASKWKYTRVDSTEQWLEFHDSNGDLIMKVGTDFFESGECLFNPGGSTLVLVAYGPKERIKEIQAWEARNASERATYERLKKKFEGT